MTAHIEPPGGWTDRRARLTLRTMLDAAIASADPARILAAHLPPPPEGRCVVVGAGKAAASMAVALEAAWPDVPLSGVVVTPYGYGMATRRIVVREAAHPVPDANSEAAAREILAAVSGLTPSDLVVVLISGGGSSVMALPAEGLTLADKQAVNRALLSSGLDIRTMNIVRRRLSAIKGGKLAEAAAPARVLTLGISDIPGDDVAALFTMADPKLGTSSLGFHFDGSRPIFVAPGRYFYVSGWLPQYNYVDPGTGKLESFHIAEYGSANLDSPFGQVFTTGKDIPNGAALMRSDLPVSPDTLWYE